MASPIIYPNGGGGSTGDNVSTRKPIYALNGGHIWYVGPGGTDAASPAGREREKPLLTTGQAVTNAVAGDTIIYLPNFTENISVSVAVNKAGLTFVSEGIGSNAARLTCTGNISMLAISAIGVSLNNMYFPASTVANTDRVEVTSIGVVIDNCYFECGANDTGRTLRYNTGCTGSCQLTNTTFAATAAQPAIGVEVATATSGMFIENVTLDGGAVGFSDFAFKATAAMSALYADTINQLNNADVSLAAGGSGIWIPGVTSASARFEQA